MAITIEQVYEQQRADKVSLDRKDLALREDVDILLRKTSDIAASLKTSSCLTSCEIDKIIKNYIDDVDVYIEDVDTSTLGTLVFTSSVDGVPPINVELCPHVAHCETKTTLAKGTGTTLVYTGESGVQNVDLSPLFTASNVSWSGTATGSSNTTVQLKLNEIILSQNASIDCAYFTGTGVGTTTLGIDDLTNVNVSGGSLSVGDVLTWDGINWVPNTLSVGGGSSFVCTDLASCSITSLSDVNVPGFIDGDMLVYNETTGKLETRPDSDYLTDTTLATRQTFADAVFSTAGQTANFQITLTNTSTTRDLQVMYFTNFALYSDNRALAKVGSDVLVDGVSIKTGSGYEVSQGVNDPSGDVVKVINNSSYGPAFYTKTIAPGATTTLRLELEMLAASSVSVAYANSIQMMIYGSTV